MTQDWEYVKLLQAVRRLRDRYVLRLLNRRMKHYHRENSSVDISDALSSHIDSLSKAGTADPRKILKSPVTEDGANIDTTPMSRNKPGGIINPVWMLTALSTHFTRRHSGRVLESHLAERLKQSTHEHINTALRFAREGDNRIARLHADIANNAQKEAAHYMPEEEYKEFSEQVLKQLNELLNR